MRGRAVGDALNQFLNKLSEGDPVAIGLAGFGALLAVAALTIWVIDRRSQQKPKGKGDDRKSRSTGSRISP